MTISYLQSKKYSQFKTITIRCKIKILVKRKKDSQEGFWVKETIKFYIKIQKAPPLSEQHKWIHYFLHFDNIEALILNNQNNFHIENKVHMCVCVGGGVGFTYKYKIRIILKDVNSLAYEQKYFDRFTRQPNYYHQTGISKLATWPSTDNRFPKIILPIKPMANIVLCQQHGAH